MNDIPSSLYHLYLSFIPSNLPNHYLLFTHLFLDYIYSYISVNTIYSLPTYYSYTTLLSHTHTHTYTHTYTHTHMDIPTYITSISDNIKISYLQLHTLCIHIHAIHYVSIFMQYILYHSLSFYITYLTIIILPL